MVVVELFAGAGGASLGLVAAGMEEVRAVEYDADACATRRAAGLRADEGDVRDPAHYQDLGTVDLLWSSFPCQAWSSAGKRLGAADERNGWPWTVDVLDRVKPRWFIAENVPGLTHHRGDCDRSGAPESCPGCYFERRILPDVAARFPWSSWTILDSADYGVPQRRRRVYIVGGPRPMRWPQPTHADPDTLRQGSMFGPVLLPWRTVQEALNLSGVIGLRAERGAGMIARHGERRDASVDAPAPQLGAGSKGSGPRQQLVYKRGRHGNVAFEAHSIDEPSCALRGAPGGSSQPFITIMREDPSRGWEAHSVDKPSPAVRAGRPGGGLRVTTSRTGRKRIEYDLTQPGHSRGPSDAVRRHPVEHGDAPASTLGALRPAFVLTNAAPARPRIPIEDQKHPHVRPDAPAPALRSGGAGHSAPPMWLRTEMTGASGTPDSEPAPTINRKANTYVHPRDPGTRAASRPELLDKPSPTVTAVGECKGSGDGGNPEKMRRASDALWLGAGIRRPTVAECAALMAWPDGYPLRGTKTSQYAQVGNGCTPPVVEALARAVIAADKERP